MRFIHLLKKLVPSVVFCLIGVFLFNWLSDVLTPKSENRYYILEKYLQSHPEDDLHDVQVFGSCHSYTSFDPIYFEERTGISAFVYGNAGEIIPTTYVRMVEQFKKHTPKVALVEIWGINPYETYSTHERVFGFYLANNLERTAFSLAKQEVIGDFDSMSFEGDEKVYDEVSYIKMNFPVVNYKERLLDGSLTDVDFDYSFEGTRPYNSDYTYNEMYSRLTRNGFKVYPSQDVSDYPQYQATVKEDELVAIEPDIVKYIQKIIDLCQDNGVELIFYRSPYISTENELKKLNHLRQLCTENNVLFLDLESELQYNYHTDFTDLYHLSETGANKSTEFLTPYILHAFEASGAASAYTGDKLPDSLLNDGGFFRLVTERGLAAPAGRGGAPLGCWRTNFPSGTLALSSDGIKIICKNGTRGWYLYQFVDHADALAGKTLTAVFDIASYRGKNFRPVISCRDAEDKEILSAYADVNNGVVTVSCVIPSTTKYIRVGILAVDGIRSMDHITLDSVALYEGAYTIDTLPAA